MLSTASSATLVNVGKVLAVSAVLALSMGLAGCDLGGPVPSDDPGADPTPSDRPGADPTTSAEPTPSETPDLRDRISSIVIDGDSVYVAISEGGIYLDVPFTTDPETAVAQLSEAIRLPEIRSTLPASMCFHERPQATWGGITFTWGTDWQRPGGAKFLASSDAERTTNGIAVTTLGGQWVGATESEVFTGAPGAYSDDFGSLKTLHYDVASGTATGSPDDYWGAIAIMEGGVLTSFSSPIHYFYDC
ncbi:hypothetical protein GCM10022239_18010 [Leifsonia bigeumensis]|uniref:Uncharacterized protein n=1 Tax=Leifsonella bigeumensis TaxID=433643 RepID=A0ABP7FNA8_9MICO